MGTETLLTRSPAETYYDFAYLGIVRRKWRVTANGNQLQLTFGTFRWLISSRIIPKQEGLATPW